MAEPALRLPVAGFDQISRILRAYLSAAKGVAGVPIKLDDVAKRAAMNKTGVSANNAFLTSLGLIEGGNNKQLTELGLQAALTLDHPGTPEAVNAWGDVMSASPDLERIVDAVRIRRGMDEDSLLSHIVLTAGVPKTSRWLTGARTVVDILEFAGVVEESDGTFTVRTPSDALGGVASVGPIDTRESEARQSQEDARTVSIAPGARSPFVINVHLWVNAKEANYEELAEELKKLLSRLSET